MGLPFTTEQFFAIFRDYNLAIWPAQVVAWLMGLAAVLLALRGGSGPSRVAAAILGVFWIWMGAVYHIGFFADINPAAYGFGGAFVLQGILFLYLGVLRHRLAFAWPDRLSALTALALILYAGIGYQALGYLGGHAYPSAPLFGVAPCPTTIFTLGMFLLARPPLPKAIAVIPVAWALVGGTAAVLLSVPEDWALYVAAAATVAVLARRRGAG